MLQGRCILLRVVTKPLHVVKVLNCRKTVNCWKNRFVAAKPVGVINVAT